jgi:hypothetical protein
MIDVPRLCLNGSLPLSIFVGRSVATVAELCFAAQWTLLLREAAGASGNRAATIAPPAVFALIVAAEMFSWSAVLTTNYLLNAIENSLWTVAAAIATVSFVAPWKRLGREARCFAIAAAVCGAGYIAFMAVVDVPMYLSRWQADVASGREYVAASDGLRTLIAHCIVTPDWAAWRVDVPWLTLYFTVAVWISIALAHVPPLSPSREISRRQIVTTPAAS